MTQHDTLFSQDLYCEIIYTPPQNAQGAGHCEWKPKDGLASTKIVANSSSPKWNEVFKVMTFA